MNRPLSEGVLGSGALDVKGVDGGGLREDTERGVPEEAVGIGGATSAPAPAFCLDREIDARIRYMHMEARREGRAVQVYIDTYLAAVGYLWDNPSESAFAGLLVMSPTDSPQEGTMPDLGCVLRSVMLQSVEIIKRSNKSGAKGVCLMKGVSKGALPCDAPYGVENETVEGKFTDAVKAAGSCRGDAAALKRVGGKRKHAALCDDQVSCGLGFKEDDLSVQMAVRVFPCLRRSSHRLCPVQNGQQVGLVILLGLLLGLYPHAAKFPPFPVRVAVYRFVHSMITGGGGVEFCCAHPMLLTLAYMEYFAHFVSAYLPVEFEVLSKEPGVAAYFSSCPLVCDAFRQELLNTVCSGAVGGAWHCEPPSLDWGRMEAHCAALVDKHMRGCKSRFKTHKEQYHMVQVDEQALCAFRHLPYVVPYDQHFRDGAHNIMGSELAFLMDSFLGGGLRISRPGVERGECGKVCVTVAAIQRLIEIHPLPGNVIKSQLRGLHARMTQCERSALDALYLYICVACSFVKGGVRSHQVRGHCKLWIGGAHDEQGLFVCSACQKTSVVAINVLGRIVSVRQQRYYLAPCCMSVQRYHATGAEFATEFCDPVFFGDDIMARMAWRPDVRPGLCGHGVRGCIPKQQRPSCDVCVARCLPDSGVEASADQLSVLADSHSGGSKSSGQRSARGAVSRTSSSLETFTLVDHLTGQLHTARLCQRHMPHSGVLRHVVNWSDFVQEVLQRGRS